MKNKNLPADRHGNSLDFLSRCSFCGSGLEQNNLTILEEQNRKTVFHVSCSRCGTSSILILSSNQAGIVSLGMATDLDRDEVKSKFSKNTISADEVIDVHEFIESGRDNLMELIRNSK